MGTVFGDVVSSAGKKAVPGAAHVVQYARTTPRSKLPQVPRDLVGKKPITIDHSFSGVADLIIQDVTHSAAEIEDIIDAEFLPVLDGGDRGAAG